MAEISTGPSISPNTEASRQALLQMQGATSGGGNGGGAAEAHGPGGPTKHLENAEQQAGDIFANLMTWLESLPFIPSFGKTKSMVESLGKDSYGWFGGGQPKQSKFLGIFGDTQTATSTMLSKHIIKGDIGQEHNSKWAINHDMLAARGAAVDAVMHLEPMHITEAHAITAPAGIGQAMSGGGMIMHG